MRTFFAVAAHFHLVERRNLISLLGRAGVFGQGFLVGIGDMLKVRRYFNLLLNNPLSINDLKAQLGVLVCQNPQDQKRFYDWFDKWAAVIAARTENLIAQLEPIA